MFWNKRTPLKGKQEGFAAIVVAMTLIIILSLIVIGFAQLIRREQNNALNKQLSTQAFYAAESGVNDAIKTIRTDSTKVGDGKTCASIYAAGGLVQANATLDSAHNVSYTCVLVNMKPSTLYHQNIGNDTKEDSNSNSWTVTADTTAAPGGFTISWTSDSKRTAAPGSVATGLLSRDNWATTNKYMGLLQLSLTPLGSGVDRASLISNTYTAYLYPTSGTAATPSYTAAAAGQASIQAAQCSSGTCSISIQSVPNSGPYLLHIVSIYDASTITIAPTAAGVNFKDTQAVIDATGKAQDVLRRIQVRYPLETNVPFPSVAVEAQDICKRMQVSPAPGATTFDSLSGACDFTH